MTEFSTSLNCPYFSLCSGCQIQSSLDNPPIWKEIQKYFLTQGRSSSLITTKSKNWRTRAKLAIRGDRLQPEIGLFRQGTHQVVSIPDCPIHHPLINTAVKQLKAAMIAENIDPYNEIHHSGLLRYMQCLVETKTDRVQLALVINAAEIPDPLNRLIHRLSSDPLWHSIWINFQPSITNRIFSEQWKHSHGELFLWETLGGVQIGFHPGCFAQANFLLFDEMLKEIQEMILKNKKVVEFYAGVGVIGLSVAHLSAHVLCTEISPFSQNCFEVSKNQLTPNVQNKVFYSLGSAASSTSFLDGAQVAIIDPPRKGLEAPFLESLARASDLEQLIYVSCGFRSFQSDCNYLLNHGWKIEKATGYVLFPGTDHVEIIASLHRPHP